MLVLSRILDKQLVEQGASKLIPEPIELNRQKTMLVIVDMQNDFVKLGGAIYLGTDAEATVPPIKKLLEKAHKNGTKTYSLNLGMSPMILGFQTILRLARSTKAVWLEQKELR